MSALCPVLVRYDAHAAAAAAPAAAGLPHGARHAAQHARHDGNELWRADGAWCHAYAGEWQYHCSDLTV